MRYSVIVSILCIAVLFLASHAAAEAPQMISYQGQLTGPGGAIIPDSSFDFTISIYDEMTGGNQLWTEIHLAVAVKNSLFNVILGSIVPIPDDIIDSEDGNASEVFLEVMVGGEIIVPRSRLVSSPFSFIARRVRGDISTSLSQIVIDYPGDSLTPPEEQLIDARCDKKKTTLTALSIDIAGDTTGFLEQATDTGGAYLILNSVGEQILEARCDRKVAKIGASSHFEGDVWDYMMKTDTGNAIVWLGHTDDMTGDTSASITQSIDEIAASIRCDYAVLPGYGNGFQIQVDTGGVSLLGEQGDDIFSTTIDESSVISQYVYDGLSQLKMTVDTGGVSLIGEQGDDIYSTELDGTAITTKYTYDGLDRVITSVDAGNSMLMFNDPSNGDTAMILDESKLSFSSLVDFSIFGITGLVYGENSDTTMMLNGDMLSFTGFDVQGVFGPGGYIYSNDAGDTNVLITPDGVIEVANLVKASSLRIDDDTATNRILRYNSNGVRRFEVMANSDSENGLNSGSNFAIRRYNDAGAPLGTALYIQRSTGFVGIGNTIPDVRLRVTGDICATGTITQCSDARFKSNIQPLDNALDRLSQLGGISFDWRCDEFPEHEFPEDRQVGFIAQELAEILPEAVSQDKEGYYSVDYGKVTPLLVEAVKELKTENAELRERLARIESLLEQLEEKNKY